MTKVMTLVVALVAGMAAGCVEGRRTSMCPGGTTTDGDCCVTGCACGASCISCSSTCRRAEALSEPDASSDVSR
jgi:hypothetical protein